MKKKSLITVVVVILILCVLISVRTCGNGKKNYAGSYIGQQGSVLVLSDNGTCQYKDGNKKDTVQGTWSIKDDKITVTKCLKYDIYANVESSSTSLLFQSDSSHWDDELFVLTK